jgi:MYXO-CTERM domain-containing protein
MEWLSFRYRATGELYYETAMAYGHDPWTNQWDFSGNGDGTLFYPGQAWRIGGKTDVPVASIRLKMIREGMEDYEYLHLLAAGGDEAFARGVADALFPTAYGTEVAPAALLAAREKLARRIVALGLEGGVDPAPSRPAAGVVAGAPLAGSGCASGGAAGLLALLGLAALARVRRR